MQILALYISGLLIGWFGHKILSKKDEISTSNWERGFEAGLDFSKEHGYVLARNDSLDEIMVEHGDDVARYKRVVE